MIVRPATADDRAFIVGLGERFAEFELPPWLRHGDVVRGTQDQLERALDGRSDDSTILVAESDGERLGFAWLLLTRDFYTSAPLAKISEIATAADGRGAGTALMLAAETWARERGCERLVLNVMMGNRRAQRFYERHGYAPEYMMLVKPISRNEEPGNREDE